MDTENDLIQQRLKKLEAIKTKGFLPYGQGFDVTHHAKEIFDRYGNQDKESLGKGSSLRLSVER